MASTPINERTILKLIAVLSKKERKRFRKFLQAPLHGSSATVLNLFGILEHWVVGSQKKPLLFEQVQADLDIAASTLEKSLSLVLGLLRDFIREEALREQPVYNHGQAIEFLHWRDLEPKDLEIEYRNYSKKLAALPESPARLYQELSLLEQITHVRSDSSQAKHNVTFDEFLIRLEEYYVSTRLKYVCGVINHRQIYRSEKALPEVDEMVERLEAMGGKLPLLGLGYYKTAKLLLKERTEIEEVREMLAFLDENCAKIDREESIAMYSFLLNTAIRQTKYAYKPYIDVVCRVYESMLKYDLLLEKGFMEGWHFRNYILLNLNLDRYETASQFFKRYTKCLRAAEARILIPEAGGHLNFEACKFREAIKSFEDLMEIPNIGPMRVLLAKLMIWRSYFELYEQLNMFGLDQMQNQYDSIRVFIQRDEKFSDMNKSRFSIFTKLFFKLIRQLENPAGRERTESMKALIKEVEGISNIAFKDWLIEAISKRI